MFDLQVLFYLSWRLGPILALVIIATAAAAANYKKQTKLVEGKASKALANMVGIADQAFRAITTVRCVNALIVHSPHQGLCNPILTLRVPRDPAASSSSSNSGSYSSPACKVQTVACRYLRLRDIKVLRGCRGPAALQRLAGCCMCLSWQAISPEILVQPQTAP